MLQSYVRSERNQGTNYRALFTIEGAELLLAAAVEQAMEVVECKQGEGVEKDLLKKDLSPKRNIQFDGDRDYAISYENLLRGYWERSKAVAEGGDLLAVEPNFQPLREDRMARGQAALELSKLLAEGRMAVEGEILTHQAETFLKDWLGMSQPSE